MLSRTFVATTHAWLHGALDSTVAGSELGWRATISIPDGIGQTYTELTKSTSPLAG